MELRLGLAPLASGETFFIGARGEEAFGATTAKGFSAYTGLMAASGTAMDPQAEHGLLSGSH
jgi:hypothetical protein